MPSAVPTGNLNRQSTPRTIESLRAQGWRVSKPMPARTANAEKSSVEKPPSDPVGRRLQADYIARNPNPAGQKDQLAAAPGNSRYDAVHARFHAAMRRIAATVGFYDINLVDAATGDVVYTVAKEVDFGSNMYHGPFVRSGFARAAQRALDPKNGGKAVIEDYSAYMPSAFAPQMFTAVPLIADGQTIGVFVAQIDIRTLDTLLTDDKRWTATGQGDTGEVQLVGEDRLLRSQSRFMAADPDRFLAQAQANGLPASVAAQIRSLGTTILYMPDHNEAVEQAFHNQTGVSRFLDSRGVEVVSAYGPIEAAGLRWAIEAKQDVGEAFAPAARLNRDLLVAAAAAAILLTFLALACAGLFMRPLRRVIAAMQSRIAGGDAVPIAVRGNDEFAELARGYNGLAATIGERDRQVAAAERRTDELLRSLYPAGLAERMRSGAEVTAETVANVTVVVTWVDGLDTLAAGRTATEMGEVLNALLDAIGGAAASHGVEPLRSLGESQIAVCGLSSPRLDHATRALAWTQSATVAVQRLGTDWAGSVSLRFGVASGDIDVLLLKRGHAAYDIWGRTLAIARRIAVDTEPGVGAGQREHVLPADGRRGVRANRADRSTGARDAADLGPARSAAHAGGDGDGWRDRVIASGGVTMVADFLRSATLSGGVVRLLGPIGPSQLVRHYDANQFLPWPPLSGRSDSARGLALPLLQPQPA